MTHRCKGVILTESDQFGYIFGSSSDAVEDQADSEARVEIGIFFVRYSSVVSPTSRITLGEELKASLNWALRGRAATCALLYGAPMAARYVPVGSCLRLRLRLCTGGAQPARSQARGRRGVVFNVFTVARAGRRAVVTKTAAL